MKTPIRKTRRAWDDPGHAHYLTYSCFRRLSLLNRNRVRGWVIDALRRARKRLDLSLWAYVIMPEHVHVLLYPNSSDYEMRRILAAPKRPVSRAAHQWLVEYGMTKWIERLTVSYPSRRVFRFWQPGGGFDHNVFKEKTVRCVVDYIHANPVRRELVSTATDWIWSSARFWDGERNVPLTMDEPFG